METNKTIETIEAAQLPTVAGQAIRSLPTTEQASLFRTLFRSLGIKGVSCKRSHAGWSATVAVSFPRAEHAEEVSWDHVRTQCETCQKNDAAERKVERILLAAYPDCGDKSDIMTDYFDYVFSVHGEE